MSWLLEVPTGWLTLPVALACYLAFVFWDEGDQRRREGRISRPFSMVGCGIAVGAIGGAVAHAIVTG